MAKAQRLQYWLVDAQDVEDAGVVRVLDMIRYDVATVVNNPPHGFYLFVSDVKTSPTLDRWRSHGLRVVWQMRQCRSEGLAVEQARAFASAALDGKTRKEQARKISRWLIDHGGRRPSEAAMEVSSWSPKKIERVFAALQDVEANTPPATVFDRMMREVDLP